MAMNLLFVDEESTLAHATMNVAFVPMFRPMLRDGVVYVLCNFDAGGICSHFRLSDFNLSLRFNESTSLTAIAEPVPRIPEQVFRFPSLRQLESLAISNTDLPDVIGQVRSITVFRDGITDDLIKVLLLLRLQCRRHVRLVASDAQASLLEKLLNNRNSDFCVLLATNVDPRMFAGNLHVNATAGTRFFSDLEVEATRDFMKSVRAINPLAKYKSVKMIEHVSLAYLNHFVLTANPQDVEFICSAKIIAIQTRRGWSFTSCSACGKKMQMRGSSFCCSTCLGPTAGGDVKYRVELVVEAASSKAVFVVYDDEMEKITGIEASDLASQMVSNDPDKVPAIITDLIGSTFTFHLRLSGFNFSAYHESFTVSRMFRVAKEIPDPGVLNKDHPVSNNSWLGCADCGSALGTSAGLTPSVEKKKPKLT